MELSSGAVMPSPGFGTWRVDASKLNEAVLTALRIGYRHFDLAALYRNEKEVGTALAAGMAALGLTRGDLFLTSKLPMHCMSEEAASSASAAPAAALATTLADLGAGACGYLDLYITHWPYGLGVPDAAGKPGPPCGYSPEAYLRVWRELEAAVHRGVVRHLGCSNMTAAKLAALWPAAAIKPVAVQVELHPCLSQPALRKWCASHGVAVTAYSPLGSPGRPDAYRSPSDPDVLSAPAVLAVAAATGRTAAQVVLAWAAALGVVALPRSTNPARIAENFTARPLGGRIGSCIGGKLRLNAAATAALAPEHMRALASMDTSVDAMGAPVREPQGRLMKGTHLCVPGSAWPDLWDIDFDAHVLADAASDVVTGAGASDASASPPIVMVGHNDTLFAALHKATCTVPAYMAPQSR